MSLNDKKFNVVQDKENWQVRVMVVGGVVGAMLGLMTSWLLVRTARETRGGPPAITTGDALKVGITAIGLIRSIAALGDKS
jgi:hypothetical protein